MKKITGILLLCFLSASLPAQQQVAKRMDSLANAYRDKNFQGEILVAKGNEIIYHKAYGYADLDKKIPLQNDMFFKMESTGKMFTAVSIMQLVEGGKLGLQQTLKELLPEINIPTADKITVHHLLTHTSGLQSTWDHPKYKFKQAYTHAALQKMIEEVPRVFDTPGKQFYYSNSGYVLLSWIVEKISGQSFDDYLATHIFQPQQMKTIHHLNDTVMPAVNAAQPYQLLNSKKYVRLNETIGPRASGAGGWIATATDMYKFMLGFDQQRYMRPATLQTMLTANHSIKKDSAYKPYAYGLETFNNDPIKGTSYFGHSGGGAGFSIDAIIDTATHFIVIYCSNIYGNAREVSSNFLRLALNQQAIPIQQPAAFRIYDLVNEKGIENFIANEKEYFKQLNLSQPSVRIMMNVGDAMSAGGDYDAWAKWMTLTEKYYPANGFVLIMKGDSEWQTGQKENALRSYQAAKAIATQNNDQRMLGYLSGKLEQLSK